MRAWAATPRRWIGRAEVGIMLEGQTSVEPTKLGGSQRPAPYLLSFLGFSGEFHLTH